MGMFMLIALSSSVIQFTAGLLGNCAPGTPSNGDQACTTKSISSEHALLQKTIGRAKIGVYEGVEGPDDPTNMVNEESGFEGGDIDLVTDTSCNAAEVRRRRRQHCALVDAEIQGFATTVIGFARAII